MSTPAPPAYAWDWFARQRLLWREVHARLANLDTPVAGRYRQASGKSDLLALLRADYPEVSVVRDVVDGAVAEIVFLGRVDVPFDRLGVRNAPRGMRWWWTALTGEHVAPPPRRARGIPEQQLSLADVHEGYGDGSGRGAP